MELKSKKVTATIIESDDFNEFVESKYGGSFEVIAIEELNNGQRKSFSAPNKAMFFGDEGEKIRSGNYPMYCLHLLAQCLFEDGHIEAGEYEINVSW